jgi:ParB family transcriptional regulator, chromosome partitioning protein
MLKSNHYQHDLIGFVENLSVSDILPSSNILRINSNEVQELTDSIKKIGLLAPVVVRSLVSGKFEIIAGNRRLDACKRLGWKRIPCCIVELDDKAAFEASIVENVQRHTLNIVEEGLAFRKYVTECGWGGISELASRLSKSSSYVSKRIRLLDLPQDVLHLICESEISISAGEELLSLDEKDKQSKLASLVVDRSLSSKKLRSIIKKKESEWYHDEDQFYSEIEDKQKRILQLFDKSIITLREAVNKLAINIEKIQDEWILFETLMYHKNSINSQIDLLIRQKKRFIKAKNFINK